MTLNEFKAWLEGFEHAIGNNAPTYDRWKAIKQKLAEVTPVMVPPPAYVPQVLPRVSPHAWPTAAPYKPVDVWYATHDTGMIDRQQIRAYGEANVSDRIDGFPGSG